MKRSIVSNERIRFSYKGASVFATGTLAKVITYSLGGLLLLVGIAAIQNALNNRNTNLLNK